MTATPVATESRITVPDGAGEVGALLMLPERPSCLLVLGHGAGAGMRHAFMERVAIELAARGIATFRYEFPYVARGRGAPDRPPVLTATVRAAVDAAAAAAPDLPLLAGGKSMGGRMTSTAASEAPLPGVRGIVFLGFPLHPPGRSDTGRSAHLDRVTVPMLFLQGTRDSLAEIELIRPVCERLGARALLHVVEGGDHSFAVLKRSGRNADRVMAELADTIAGWGAPLLARSAAAPGA
jgi:predicted alpha/beta-hydrolase family hydrolase